MNIYYPSQEKLQRAKYAVNNYDVLMRQHPEISDLRLVDMGKGKKLEGDALVDYVYQGLGGSAKLEGVEAIEAEKNAKIAVARTKKKANVVEQREKIVVK